MRFVLALFNLALIGLLLYLSWYLWLGGDFFEEVVTIKREDPSRYVPKTTRGPVLPSSFYKAVKMLARVPTTAAEQTVPEKTPTPIRTAVMGVIHQFLGVLYDKGNPNDSGVFVVARVRSNSYMKLVGLFFKVGDVVVENPEIRLDSVVEKVPNLRYDFVFRDKKGKTATISLSLE